MTTWQKIGMLFGLPASATEKEIDAEVETRLAALENEKTAGADAGAETTEEAVKETATPEASTDTPAPTLSAAEIKDIVTAAVTAAVAPLNERLKAVETDDAAEETGGTTEAAETGAPKERAYTNSPMNVAVRNRIKK